MSRQRHTKQQAIPRIFRTWGIILCMGIALPSLVNAAPGRVLMASSFENRPGTWTIINYPGSLSGQILYGQSGQDTSDAVSAEGAADIPSTGQYRVWVRCREFQFDRPGIRFFDVRLGDGLYQERFADEGLHDGMGWEDGGIVTLNTGTLPVQIIDTSASFARFDALLITPDLSSTPPPNNLSSVLAIADLADPLPPLPPPPPLTNLLFMPTSFDNNHGTWSFVNEYGGALTDLILIAPNDGHPETKIPAQVTTDLPTTDTYRIWVRCRDYAFLQPGTRYFNVRLNDGVYDERVGDEGSHDGYGWEIGTTVTLPMGDLKAELVDTAAHLGRFDALFITNDINYTPPDDYKTLLEIATLVEPRWADASTQPPDWATSDETPVTQEEIGNSLVKVQLFETPSDGRTIIQKQTSVYEDGAWHAIGDRTDLFAYVAMYAYESSFWRDLDFASDLWNYVTEEGGEFTTRTTANIFRLGEPQWLVPFQMNRIDASTIELKAAADLATLTVTWSIPSGAQEPVVECELLAGQTGSWSLGVTNGPETELENVDYVLCAKPYLGKYVPSIPALVRENASPNACSLMTLPLDSPAGNNTQATFGVTPDPSSYPYRWATPMDSRFGLGIRGPRGGVQPWLFAPLPGRAEGYLHKGEMFRLSYHPLAQIGGWNDLFRHVTDDILEIRDVKKNYYCSLTDTIFNIQDLIMADWRYSGWSDRAMAFSYVEASYNHSINNFNHSSPLTLVQNYLFTEDPDWYAQRAIPTLAYWLSRNGWMSLPLPPSDWSEEWSPDLPALGGYGQGYPASIFAGFYLMSRGRIPAYRAYGFGKASPGFREDIYRYRFTKDPALLEEARLGADDYIEAQVYSTPTTLISKAFEIPSTAPNVPALMSMYEVTGDTKYLDAAEESARKLLAHGTWMQPRVPDANMFLSAEELRNRKFRHDVATFGYSFNGDQRIILGYRVVDGRDPNDPRAPMERTDAFERIQDETVPAWLLSRVGLNVEGGSQLSHRNSSHNGNISMNCYAPDLVRLSQYTGDPFYETVARHETLGRSANYPGYYITHMSTIYMKP
ncbi:hypothetical protein HQ520_10165, partial [bacterium]|nr:hypothetical protein [bacterium]